MTGMSPGTTPPAMLGRAPPPMMNLYTHRHSRKRPVFYQLSPYIQKGLARVVHTELQEEEVYKDMEFSLTYQNDKITRRIETLQHRFQRMKEISDCHSAPAQSTLSLTILTVTIPFFIHFLIFMIIVEVSVFR